MEGASRSILRGVQLFGYLDGTTPMPAAMVIEGTGTTAKRVINPDRATWIVQDQAILGGLLSSMTEDVLPQLTRQIDTSNQLWTSLHTMFSAQHRGNSIQIRTQLSTTRKGDMSAAEYYQKMMGFADTMANIGHPMSDEEVIGYILAGLRPGHSDLFTAITVLSNQRAVTLPEFYSYLLAHEAQATLVNGSTPCVKTPMLLAVPVVITATMATPTPTTIIGTTIAMVVAAEGAAVDVARTMGVPVVRCVASKDILL